LAILSIAGGLVLFGSRRWALIGMLTGALYLTQGQYFVVGGFAMYPTRALEVAALVRVVARSELPSGGLSRLDVAFAVLYVFSVVVFVLRSGDDAAFYYQIGAGVDAVCLYAVFRALIRTTDELRSLLRAFAIMLVPYAYLVWVESLTFQNSFAPIGGVELIRAGDVWIREGRLRATGSFGHPSLMGTVGGTFLPLYMGLLFVRPSDRWYGMLGAAACLALVGASNSGGPLLCAAAAGVGWSLWPMRRSMQLVRVALLGTLILFAVSMKAPIWYLLARISSVTGGDGYHRAVLLDIAFQNLDRWWLAGMPARDTGTWLPYTNTNTGAVDITNNFLSFGINAGMGALMLLVVLVVVAFSQLGRVMRVTRSAQSSSIGVEPLYWALGVMLFAHVVNWFGVTYWDQTNVLWLLHLAAIGSLADHRHGTAPFLKDDVTPSEAAQA
jgi:hypothetical protein